MLKRTAIRALCNTTAYQRGLDIYRTGKRIQSLDIKSEGAVDKISAKVEDLCDNYSPNYFDSLELEHFRHTINTEVSYVENAKSKTKAESFMAKATKQLKVDLFSILEKANDIE